MEWKHIPREWTNYTRNLEFSMNSPHFFLYARKFQIPKATNENRTEVQLVRKCNTISYAFRILSKNFVYLDGSNSIHSWFSRIFFQARPFQLKRPNRKQAVLRERHSWAHNTCVCTSTQALSFAGISMRRLWIFNAVPKEKHYYHCKCHLKLCFCYTRVC